jgi:predicted helicase
MGKDPWSMRSDELEVRVTTDPADIARFLRARGRRVIFGTYASSARIAEAQALSRVPRFDLVVADEAHRVAGITTRGNAKERDIRVVLDGERIRARRRLFATATPRVYGPAARGRFADREDIEFVSMDDPEHFGVQAHELWFRRAVELKRLVDYRLLVAFFLGFGSGSSAAVRLMSCVSHSLSSISPSMRKDIEAPGKAGASTTSPMNDRPAWVGFTNS